MAYGKEMPTVLKHGAYRFFFASQDKGEPPHVHVRRENRVAKFWLEPVSLERAGGFSRVELNAVGKLVEDYQDEFLEKWHGFFGD